MRLQVSSLATSLMALALLAAPAQADPPRAATRFFAAGNYLAAAGVAEAQPFSASSLAFAARALMAACVTATDRSQIDGLLDRAEDAAGDSLALDPDSVEARLQLALALGMRARRATIAEAIAHNYAPRGRELLQQALARAPDEAWGHALLGAWHLEVLRRGGRTGAALYGARLNTGLAEFARARALAPHDPLIALHNAVALIEYDAVRFEAEARGLLAVAAADAHGDALETHASGEARRLALVLDAEGPAAATRAARVAFP